MLIDFWASWCRSCRETMPDVKRMHETYGPKGLQIVAITMETKQVVRAFKRGKPYTYPLYIDTTGNMNKAFNVDSIPRAVVVDSNGVVVWDVEVTNQHDKPVAVYEILTLVAMRGPVA